MNELYLHVLLVMALCDSGRFDLLPTEIQLYWLNSHTFLVVFFVLKMPGVLFQLPVKHNFTTVKLVQLLNHHGIVNPFYVAVH